MELYDKIENPIDDLEIIQELVQAYKNYSKYIEDDFYTQLMGRRKKSNVGNINIEDEDKLYTILFNKWKNSILSLKESEYFQGNSRENFIKLKNYLKHLPNFSTKQEILWILYGHSGDEELNHTIEKYSWKSFGEFSGWEHICSKYLTAQQDPFPRIEHRLYLNIEAPDIYKMVIYLIEKLELRHKPYYFKFDKKGKRNDTVVIYASTEDLAEYVEILQEIKKEHPDLIARAKEPPLLTGKIDGWIGYGSDPGRDFRGYPHSFNEVRANMLEPIIEKITAKWILEHKNMEISSHGKLIPMNDYIALRMLDYKIKDLETDYFEFEKMIKENGKSSKIAFDRLGYTPQILHSSEFKQKCLPKLKKQTKKLLSGIINDGWKQAEPITVDLKNNHKIEFSGLYCSEVLQELSTSIVKNDPNYLLMIRREIKNQAKQYGIDKNKFCFDIKAKNQIEAFNFLNNDHQDKNFATIHEEKISKLIDRMNREKDYLNQNLEANINAVKLANLFIEAARIKQEDASVELQKAIQDLWQVVSHRIENEKTKGTAVTDTLGILVNGAIEHQSFVKEEQEEGLKRIISTNFFIQQQLKRRENDKDFQFYDDENQCKEIINLAQNIHFSHPQLEKATRQMVKEINIAYSHDQSKTSVNTHQVNSKDQTLEDSHLDKSIEELAIQTYRQQKTMPESADEYQTVQEYMARVGEELPILTSNDEFEAETSKKK